MTKKYIDLLRKKLKFPIEAEARPYGSYKHLKYGDKVKIIWISYEDDLYGIICDIKLGLKKYSIPLVELEVDKKSPAYRIIRHYQFAFGNR